MQNELAGIEQSTEFLCPNCGTAAFEVIGTQWNSDDDGGTGGEEFLIMRCLDCLHLFHYHLKGGQSSVILAVPEDTLTQKGTRLSDN